MEQAAIMEKPAERQLDSVEHGDLTHDIDLKLEAGEVVQMRSELDNMQPYRAAFVYWRVSLICIAAAFCGAMDGYQVQMVGSIVSNKGFIRLMSNGGVKLNPTHVSVWGGMQSTGQFVGVLSLQFGIDKIGRKAAMHLTWIALVIAVALESSSKNWIYWLFAKLLGGAGLGMMQATYPLYISEQSPAPIRGFLVNAYLFWYVFAQIFAPVVLRQVSRHDPYNWKMPVLTQWAMLGILLIINVLLPESPWWLVQRHKVDRAGKVLATTRKGVAGFDVKQEVSILVATVEHERLLALEQKSFDFFQIFKGTNLWRLFIAFWPKAMQQFAGQSVTNNYATYFFQLAGNKDPFLVTIILACCQLIGIGVAALVSDTLGRRWLVMGAFIAGTAAILGIAIVGCFDYADGPLGKLLVFFASVSNFGVIGGASAAYSYVNEIPSQRLRARTASIALCGSFLLGICFNYTVPLMLDVWIVKAGFFFACTGTISCIIGWFVLPEIARRTPAEIDELFEAKIAPRKFRNYKTQVQINLEEKRRAGEA